MRFTALKFKQALQAALLAAGWVSQQEKDGYSF